MAAHGQGFDRLGQLTAVVVNRTEGGLEVLDGFKRVRAAQALGWQVLRGEVLEVDGPGAKVRVWECNAGPGLSELEEGWLVRALYREDELSQPRIAQLLGRHKSWVSRRLMLVEGLSDGVQRSARRAGIGRVGGQVNGARAGREPFSQIP